MNHIVRITVPEDDGIPGFLVNDPTNIEGLPDDVFSIAREPGESKAGVLQTGFQL
jgi:hypothetical protein